MRLKSRHLIISSLAVTLLAGSSAFGQNKTNRTVKRKTVGELLSQTAQGPASGKLQMSKTDTSLPTTNLGFRKQPVQSYNLDAVKPPRSSDIMRQENGGKAQYEKVLDQQIRELYKLTQRFRSSPNRGELWLRLAELYVEKAGLVDARMQDQYDARLKAFQAGKTKVKPKLNTAEAKDYNRKAIQLYEWFQRDFPNDPKMSQALFFLGYNYFELGDVKKGAEYYEKLTKTFPKSPFVGEAHFALGEFYFENEKWSDAYKQYSYLIKDRKHRLNTFALYKGGWCLFRLGKTKQAMSYLEYIIKIGKTETGDQLAGKKTINRNRLEGEALRDLVIFYAEAGEPEKAASYFRNLVGNEAGPYLEKLAYQYSDRGNKDASREVFKLLIAQNPTSPKSFDYQYQIVQNYYHAKNNSLFKAELYNWVKNFDAQSPWYSANKGNKELIENSYKLRETTLRNYVLQQHQTAQNSRAPFSQGQADEGYQLYLAEFPDSAAAPDMHFYYGELLYDMNRFEEAATQYKWVADNAPKSKFYTKAAQNLLLSVEKGVPSDAEMQKRVGNSVDPLPLDPKVDRFIKAGQWFTEKFPTSDKTVEIKFRIGRLYYQSNQFDEATKYFRQVVQQYPNTKYAEYSANLLLDIYNIRKDYAGLERVGAELMAVPAIASSKAGGDIRRVLENASFKRGQDLEVQKKYGDSAQVFDAFAKQNPTSPLAMTALFNAGVNYERAGMNAPSIQAYQAILSSNNKEADKFKVRTRRLLAKRYQDSAQFEEAAKLYRQSAQDDPKDPLAPNLIFNAAVLYEALGKTQEAIRAYEDFIRSNKKHSDNIEAVYSIAQIHRKAGQRGPAIARYTEYVEKGGSVPEKVVESAYWVSELYAQQKSVTKAKEWRQRTLAIQKRLAPDKRGPGASYAAKLKLQDTMATFEEMRSIRFPADPSKQKAAADRKINLLGKLTTELAEVIKFDSAEEIVSSLSILGQANENMAQSIITAPLPPGLNAEETKQYKEGVEKFAEPFMGKARDSFKLAVERGWELEVYNDGYKTAYSYMNKLDPKTYYDRGEVGMDIRLVNWIGQ